jgi:endonuclease/exonuclease/phosphatase (EEP) superfamily protein YafD
MAFKSAFMRAVALLATLAVSTALIVGFFGRVHPAFDSFAHFRAHLAVALLLCAVALMFARFRRHAAVAALLAAGAIATTLSPSPFRFNAAQAAYGPSDPDRATYRLLQLNLRGNHPDPNRVLSLIGRVKPDVLTLEEVSYEWSRKLALLEAAYPYRMICGTTWNANAVLSRRPFVDARRHCDESGRLAIASVDFGGTTVDFAAIHLSWPWPFAQHRQVDELEPAFGALGKTAILAGDFNATTWSAAVERVATAGQLTLVDGIGPTWLDYMFPRSMLWAGLPIDHMMVKGDIEVHSAVRLEDAGSDHWPLLMKFSLKAAEPEAETAMAGLISP